MGDGMLSLSWNNHKATFCHILANLRDKERYTDVTLACEGKFYRVHKLVLSTCSEYFEVMFENTPCKHPVIVLNHIKHDEVEALLSYMYAGVVNVAQNDLARLIKAAELLKIKGLAVPDEPPQEAEARKSHPSPWSARDERTSPLPKRRRKDDSSTPQGGSQTSNSPASSPRASPFMDNSEYVERSRTHSEGQSSDHRGERTDYRSDPLSTRLDDNSDKRLEQRSSTEQSPVQTTNLVDETLVKEEILDAADDSRDNVIDSGLDYGSIGAENRLDSSNDGSNTILPNKFDTPMMPSQSQLPEPVVEALAGPSGMQGWLGDMGGGFSSVESFRGEGSQQDIRQPLPSQQPHQMAGQPVVENTRASLHLSMMTSHYLATTRLLAPHIQQDGQQISKASTYDYDDSNFKDDRKTFGPEIPLGQVQYLSLIPTFRQNATPENRNVAADISSRNAKPKNEESLDATLDDVNTSDRIVYRIAGITEKGKPQLVDSEGYTYTVKSQKPHVTYWRCSVRNQHHDKANVCHATVIQRGEAYTPGPNYHNHAARAEIDIGAEVMQVKNKAITNMFYPAP